MHFVCCQILKPPAGYQPIRTPARKLTATPTPMGMSGFRFQMEDNQVKFLRASIKNIFTNLTFFQVKIVDDMQPTGENMPYMKAEDAQYFQKLLVSF